MCEYTGSGNVVATPTWQEMVMLMPALSVTVIGIAIAVLAIMRGKGATGALLSGVLGAWLGFIVGAIPGLVLDVVLGDGRFLALLGHIGAVGGALVAVMRFPTAAATGREDRVRVD